MSAKPQSKYIRLNEARELLLARTGRTFDSDLVRLVMDGELKLFGRYCHDFMVAEPRLGEIEPILTGRVSEEKWNWDQNSISLISLVETTSLPKHHYSGFSDVSFARGEFVALLEKLVHPQLPAKRRGPNPKYDPELILSILEAEDFPQGSRSQGELARALVADPELKSRGLKEAYAERLVRKFRGI